MRDRGTETDRSKFTMMPAPNPRRGGSQTRPLFCSRTLQTYPRQPSND